MKTAMVLNMVAIALLVVSCAAPKFIFRPGQSILDRALAEPNVVIQVTSAEQDSEGDQWRDGTPSRPARRNVSRSLREADVARRVLEGVKVTLPLMSTEDLIVSLKTASIEQSFSGVRYYVYRDGNAAIVKELKRRPRSEFVNNTGSPDARQPIFTGDSGSFLTIHELIEDLTATSH